MQVKYLRGLEADIPTNNGVPGSTLFNAKLLYEFWGFCVNGSNNLQVPGGFATISGTLAPNYIRMPTNFESGSAVLIASGSDGSTSYGTDIFIAPSINWTSGSMVGRYLVTWKSGSTSTDDSIYRITRVINSSSIRVDVTTGGTPMSQSNYELRFDNRNSINFRVVDVAVASQLTGYTPGSDYMILQFVGSDINTNQANSQLYLRFGNGSFTYSTFVLNCSPSGSWNGTSFSDLGPTITPESYPSGDSPFIEAFDFTRTIGGLDQTTIIADKGGIIFHRNQPSSGSIVTGCPSFFHVEIPERLYPQQVDPNPITYTCVGRKGISTRINYSELNVGYNYAHAWEFPNPYEPSTSRRCSLIFKSIAGYSGTSNLGFYSNSNTAVELSQERNKLGLYNLNDKSFLIQDLYLGHTRNSNSFSICRAKLRLAKFLLANLQRHSKVGKNGEWIAVKDGVLWPWDNAQLPRQLFKYGA